MRRRDGKRICQAINILAAGLDDTGRMLGARFVGTQSSASHTYTSRCIHSFSYHTIRLGSLAVMTSYMYISRTISVSVIIIHFPWLISIFFLNKYLGLDIQ